MSATTSRQNSNGRFSGRRGRRNQRRRNQRSVSAEKPKKFIERCPYVVGSPEWGIWRAQRSSYEPYVPISRGEVDSEFIPKVFGGNHNKQDEQDDKMFKLQKMMIDNRWKLCEDDNGQYFQHSRYTNKRVEVHTHIARDGRTFKIPMMVRDEDPEGLGCSIEYTHPQLYYNIMPNAYTNYYETRTGRRREKYLEYLDRRMKKRAEIQKEEAAAAKAKLEANRTI